MAYNRIGQCNIKNKTKIQTNLTIKAGSSNNSNLTNRIIVGISEEDKEEVEMVVDIVQIIGATSLYQVLREAEGLEVVAIKNLNIIIIKLRVKINGLSLLEVRGLMITRCKTPHSLNPNTIKIHQAIIINSSFNNHSNNLELLSGNLQ